MRLYVYMGGEKAQVKRKCRKGSNQESYLGKCRRRSRFRFSVRAGTYYQRVAPSSRLAGLVKKSSTEQGKTTFRQPTRGALKRLRWWCSLNEIWPPCYKLDGASIFDRVAVRGPTGISSSFSPRRNSCCCCLFFFSLRWRPRC